MFSNLNLLTDTDLLPKNARLYLIVVNDTIKDIDDRWGGTKSVQQPKIYWTENQEEWKSAIVGEHSNRIAQKRVPPPPFLALTVQSHSAIQLTWLFETKLLK